MAGRLSLVVLALLLAPSIVGSQELVGDPEAVVRAVIFYSPSCPHCQDVLTEGLPPILERYGDRIRIVAVNTATPGGQQLFRAAIDELSIPRGRIGVPTLLVGTRVLVGSLEIPELLPSIADSALAAGGLDWPPVPLIREALAGVDVDADTAAPDTAGPARADPPPAERAEVATAADEPGDSGAGRLASESPALPVASPERPAAPAGDARAAGSRAGSGPVPERGTGLPGEPGPADEEDEAADAEPGEERDPGRDSAIGSVLGAAISSHAAGGVHSLSVADRLQLDPVGNGTAIAALVLMVAALALVLADVVWSGIRIPELPVWVVPVLALLGLGVAGYLSFVEVTGADAVCGPVGDCNTVQQSSYARLFGVLPLGLLGLAGFAVILFTWAVSQGGPAGARRPAAAALWSLALVAALFSIYLTFLEPFVIGATCMWCLASAGLVTLILLAATPGRHEPAR